MTYLSSYFYLISSTDLLLFIPYCVASEQMMAFKLLPVPKGIYGAKTKALRALVTQFNSIPTTDDIQRLFYLQKINYLLNTMELNDKLFEWLNNPGVEGWLMQLEQYSINPYAAFSFKGIQFAQAIAIRAQDKTERDDSKDEYYWMQKRDNLLKNNSYEECQDEYIALSCQLDELAKNTKRIKDMVSNHSKILHAVKPKLDAIQGKKPSESNTSAPSYKTKILGEKINNYNFELTMEGWDKPFVLCVEDEMN